MSSPLQFTAPRSFIEPSFWTEFYHRKLHIWKLSQNSISVTAKVDLSDGDLGGALKFSKESFTASEDSSLASGRLVVVNTVEEFRDIDKRALIERVGWESLRAMLSGSSLNLCGNEHFVLLVFGELKDYRFTYWLARPALVPRSSLYTSCKPSQALDGFGNLLSVAYAHFLRNQSERVFVCRREAVEENAGSGFCSFPVSSLPQDGDVLVIADEGVGETLGWSGRNLLLALTYEAFKAGQNELNLSILLLRNTVFRSGNNALERLAHIENSDRSQILHLSLSNYGLFWEKVKDTFGRVQEGLAVTEEEEIAKIVQVVGWEPNERGKAGPRLADLQASLNPHSLINQATDLNLHLMKWRLWPELDTQLVQNTRCLLLGAGTLGCAVGRLLLGYGVRSITFVDSGKVHYSTPTRQCLYTSEDCVSGVYKATQAATRLIEVNPTIKARGEVLAIPMPGHPILSSDNATVTADGECRCLEGEAALLRFEQLVEDHDVLFALTDSREARWLPTVLAKARGKIVVNAALGFDSYLVMHHGVPESPHSTLGCYFCNDVVSAGNSTRNRTLDQQCTITRPGLAFIAAGIAVEMLVNLLHGLPTPHQVRGSLVDFSQLTMQSPAFPCCTACSAPVVEAYNADSIGFVRQVCHQPGILEEISGVRQIIDRLDATFLDNEEDDF
eukprot:gene10795-11997_t